MSSPALQCLTLSAREGRRPAVRRLDLEIFPGEVYGLFGPAGAGKTSVLRALAGLLRPRSGSCRVLGIRPGERSLTARRRLGYAPQGGGIPAWMDAHEAEALVAGLQPSWDPSLYGELLEALEVPGETPAGSLAPEEFASLGIALALGHRPHALLLDDPYGGADPALRASLLEPVLEGARQSGMAVLLAARDAGRLEALVDRVGVLAEGRLVREASTADLRERYRRVTLSYVGEPIPDIRLEGVLRLEVEAMGFTLIVDDWSEEMHLRLRALRPSTIRAVPLGLEEVVAELVRASREPGEAAS